MALTRFVIDGYGQLELNNVAFRRDGRVEAQCALDATDFASVPAENGMLLAVDRINRVVKFFDSSDDTYPIALNYTTALETIETLNSEKEELNNFKIAAELKEKEAVIDKYATLLEETQINDFREKIDDFTKEELDKELAFALVQTKSTIFTNDDSGFIPKDEHILTGVEAILERQKNKTK